MPWICRSRFRGLVSVRQMSAFSETVQFAVSHWQHLARVLRIQGLDLSLSDRLGAQGRAPYFWLQVIKASAAN